MCTFVAVPKVESLRINTTASKHGNACNAPHSSSLFEHYQGGIVLQAFLQQPFEVDFDTQLLPVHSGGEDHFLHPYFQAPLEMNHLPILLPHFFKSCVTIQFLFFLIISTRYVQINLPSYN